MSKISKRDTVSRVVNMSGRVPNKSKAFAEEWTQFFKDWLEPVRYDPMLVKCNVCNVVLKSNRKDLLKHASSPCHGANVQSSRKRKALSLGKISGRITGKIDPTAGSSSGGPARKIISLRRNLPPKVDCEMLTENSNDLTVTEGEIKVNVISHQSSMNENLMQLRKRKTFRSEWLDLPEFKDWLSPDPDSPYKARCLACKTKLNAGKSELEKHGAGARHAKAEETFKKMLIEQQEREEDSESDDDDSDDYEPLKTVSTQTRSSGAEMSDSSHMLQETEQVKLYQRIVDSIDDLTSSLHENAERLTKNHEVLMSIMEHLSQQK